MKVAPIQNAEHATSLFVYPTAQLWVTNQIS